MIQQKITEIAEILGWSVDFSEPQNGKTDVNFAKYTSYGQDFNFSVKLEDDNMEPSSTISMSITRILMLTRKHTFGLAQTVTAKMAHLTTSRTLYRIWRKRKNKYTTCWKHLRQNLSNAHDDDL